MKRTVTRLDDGRELIYFDERDDIVREDADRRRLPPPPPGAELRYDPLLDEWVAIAAHRQSRTFLPPSSECPLCPSTPDRSTEIPAQRLRRRGLREPVPDLQPAAARAAMCGPDAAGAGAAGHGTL